MSKVASQTVLPESVEQVAEVVRESSRVHLVSGGSKTASQLTSPDATVVQMSKLCGIVQYEPSEFTFTARAGTPLQEIAEAIAQRNQYLPFDPPLVDQGATIGGTVAAGLSGPGRFRYGGVSDFLLGVQLVDGTGVIVNAGGKVVKNAAGFDVPKLMVGSLGTLGVLTELTFKIFPRPQELLSVRWTCSTHDDAIGQIAELAHSRFELDAIDYRANEKSILIRIAGPTTSNRSIAEQLESHCKAGSDFQKLDDAEAVRVWKEIGDLSWAGNEAVVLKVPVTPSQFLELQDWCERNDSASIHLSVAGGVAWISITRESIAGWHAEFCKREVRAMVVRGECDRVYWGDREASPIAKRIKLAMDPQQKLMGHLK